MASTMASKILPQAKFFNRRLLLSTLLIGLSSFNFGFDNQGYATTQAMDAFTKQFGTRNPKTGAYSLETNWLALFSSLQYITYAAGVWIGTLVSARLGRRWCITIMSCWALCTATIAITSTNRDQILAARVLNYIYVGMELSVVPVYQSEIVPTPIRGFVVSSYQLSLITGQVIINCVCRGTSGINGSAAYRIPYGLFYLIPTIVLSGIWFIPESPVWLLTAGRTEDARKAHYELREGVYPDTEIEALFEEARINIEMEQEMPRFLEIFKGIHLRRTLLVVAANFFQQATGQVFASQYGAIWIKSLNTISAFDMTIIIACSNFAMAIFSIIMADKIGRKPLLYAGTTIQTLALFTMAILTCINPTSPSFKLGTVAMLAVASVSFCMGLATLIYVMSTEIPSQRLRDHTIRIGFMTKVVTNFVVAYSVPYLIKEDYANIGGRIGFIFGGICVLSLVFIYFCVPECKGKTIEEIELMFQHGVPLRKFKSCDSKSLVLAAQAEYRKTDTKIVVQQTKEVLP